MRDEPASGDDLVRRAGEGDEQALAELFAHSRDRLRRMVYFRLDRRLRGRVDPSDVLQEAYLDLAHKLPGHASKPPISFFLWLRLVVGKRLLRVHRLDLDAAARDASREVLMCQGIPPRPTRSRSRRTCSGRSPRPAGRRSGSSGGHVSRRCST